MSNECGATGGARIGKRPGSSRRKLAPVSSSEFWTEDFQKVVTTSKLRRFFHRMMQKKKCLAIVTGTFFMLVYSLASLRSWRWKPYVLPKRQLTFTGLHGRISQKTEHCCENLRSTVTVVGVPAEIGIEHLPNPSGMRYHSSLFFRSHRKTVWETFINYFSDVLEGMLDHVCVLIFFCFVFGDKFARFFTMYRPQNCWSNW
jgi:hypothetical protein